MCFQCGRSAHQPFVNVVVKPRCTGEEHYYSLAHLTERFIMKAEFVEEKVDRDIVLTMKESEAKMYRNVIGKTSVGEFEEKTGLDEEACRVPEKIFFALGKTLINHSPKE